jgi:hypothetical protein
MPGGPDCAAAKTCGFLAVHGPTCEQPFLSLPAGFASLNQVEVHDPAGEAMNSLGYFRDVINHVPLLSVNGGPLTSSAARGDRSRFAFPLSVDRRSGRRGWRHPKVEWEWNLAVMGAPIRDHPAGLAEWQPRPPRGPYRPPDP